MCKNMPLFAYKTLVLLKKTVKISPRVSGHPDGQKNWDGDGRAKKLGRTGTVVCRSAKTLVALT